jgi:hypothetical protein
LLDQDLSPVNAFYSEHQETSEIISVVAMVAVAIAIFIVLKHYLAKLLGASGVAISRWALLLSP